MNELEKASPNQRHLSATELRKLPPNERAAILEAQAAIADEVYRTHCELIDFEAFGEEDLHGDSHDTEEG
jgi:hypothetical protein